MQIDLPRPDITGICNRKVPNVSLIDLVDSSERQMCTRECLKVSACGTQLYDTVQLWFLSA